MIIPATDNCGKPVTEIRHFNESTTNKEFTTVSIPEGIKVIGNVFSCSQLARIEIPASVEHIEEGFASYCPLTEIVVHPDNKFYDSRNGCNAIIDKRTNTLIQGCINTVIPEGVEVIGKGAFLGCSLRVKGFHAIGLPDSVKKISDFAFFDCCNLECIRVSEGVTEIGEYAFSDCTNLKTIYLPNSLQRIGGHAFENNKKLEYIRIPDVQLGKDVFYYVLNPDIVISTTPKMKHKLQSEYASFLKNATFICK